MIAMNRFFWATLLGAILGWSAANAQNIRTERCKTAYINAKRQGVVIPQGSTALQFEKWLRHQQHIAELSLRATAEEPIFVVSVVVHIVHFGEEIGVETNLSAEQIYSQFSVLNEDYNRLNRDTTLTPAMYKTVAASPGFYFQPAMFDPDGNPLDEPGIHRFFSEKRLWNSDEVEEQLTPVTIWDPNRYLNIWVANLANNTIGFGYYPVGAAIDGMTPDLEFGNMTKDGIVVNYRHFGSNFTDYGKTFDIASQYNQGRTATHEVGHWLGLRHTWGDDLFDCAIDDFCTDTPATRATSEGIGGDCANANNSCTEDENDLPDMLQNYMTYANDACMNLFTRCQVERMRTVIQTAQMRREINANPPGVPENLTVNYEQSGALLQWTPTTANSSAMYLIERADSLNGTFRIVGTSETTTFTDASVQFNNLEDVYYYRVTVATPEGVSLPSDIVSLDALTSTNPAENTANALRVFPNPATSDCQLVWEGTPAASGTVTLWNATGQRIGMYTWGTMQQPLRISLKNLPKGLYWLQLQAEGQSVQQKLLKQ